MEITKEKLLKDIEITEQQLSEQYRPHRKKVNKAIAEIWYEIMWSEKMPPEERTLTAEKLKKLRELFIAALQEEKDIEDENNLEHNP